MEQWLYVEVRPHMYGFKVRNMFTLIRILCCIGFITRIAHVADVQRLRVALSSSLV